MAGPLKMPSASAPLAFAGCPPGSFSGLPDYYGSDSGAALIPAGGSADFLVTVSRDYVGLRMAVQGWIDGTTERDDNLQGLGIQVLQTSGWSHLIGLPSASQQIPASMASCGKGGLDLGAVLVESGTPYEIRIVNNGGLGVVVDPGLLGINYADAKRRGLIDSHGCGGVKQYVGSTAVATTAGGTGSLSLLSSRHVKVGNVYATAVATVLANNNRSTLSGYTFESVENAGDDQIVRGSFPGACLGAGFWSEAEINGSTPLNFGFTNNSTMDSAFFVGAEVAAYLG